MPTKSIIEIFQTQPKAVLDLVAALQIPGPHQTDPHAIRRFLYPGDNDADRRWNDYLDTAESLGLVTREPLVGVALGNLDEKSFGRLLRHRFRDEERAKGTNALIYVAYRAALEIEPELTGGTPTRSIIDGAEAYATQVLGSSQQRRFGEDNLRIWRRWISAAGLGFMARGRSQDVFVICPVIAIKDELETWSEGIGEPMPMADFIDTLDSVPLIPENFARDARLPTGTASALKILDDEGLLRLHNFPDSRRRWAVPGRPVPVSHIEVTP